MKTEVRVASWACDEPGCDESTDRYDYGSRADEVRAAARRDGWYIGINGAAYCPDDAYSRGIGAFGRRARTAHKSADA